MAPLFRYEFRRILRSRCPYICIAISAVIVFLALLSVNTLNNLLPEDQRVLGDALYGIKQAFGMSLFTVLAAIVVSVFITEEYAQETIKNVYGKGYGKNAVFWVTYLTSLSAVVVFFLFDLLVGFLSGLLFFGRMGTAGENYALSVLGLFLIVLAYHSLFFAISISLRKPAPAIAASIAGPLVLSAIVLLFDSFALKNASFKLADIWLSGRSDAMALTNVPIAEFGKTVGTVAVVVAASLLISYFVNKKRES